MKSFNRLLVLSTVFLFVVSISLAQQGPRRDVGVNSPGSVKIEDDRPIEVDPGQTLSIDVDLVNVDVVVTDNRGNPIGGLTKDHFKLFDDNVEQKITNFAPSDAPLTIVILVEFGDTFGYYVDDVVQPAAGFIQSLRPEDWGALVAYDLRTEILTDFTKSKTELFNGLSRLRVPAYRETNLYDAVYETLERMEGIDGKKAVFLLSTGIDTLSKRSYGDILRKSETSDTMIYSVSMGQLYRLRMEMYLSGIDNISFLQADNVLRSISENSGGQAFFPRFPGEHPGIYETVGALLRNQYSLGFVPTNRKADGKQHKLRVEVPEIDVDRDGKPDKLRIRHKKAYYAPKS